MPALDLDTYFTSFRYGFTRLLICCFIGESFKVKMILIPGVILLFHHLPASFNDQLNHFLVKCNFPCKMQPNQVNDLAIHNI